VTHGRSEGGLLYLYVKILFYFLFLLTLLLSIDLKGRERCLYYSSRQPLAHQHGSLARMERAALRRRTQGASSKGTDAVY
jgi:hypothetical protein